MIGQIGKMMRELREERRITQGELGRNIISTPELSRIENGEKEPDIFTLSALLQRLGKSLGLFEIMLSDNEYRLLELREAIQDCIRIGNYKEAKTQMDIYAGKTKGKKVLHSQYLRMMEGVLLYIEGRKIKESLECFEEALKLSVPFETSGKKPACFSVQELQIVLLMACVELEEGDRSRGMRMSEWVECYVSGNYSAEDIRERIFPLCRTLFEKGNHEGKHCFSVEHVMLKLLFLDTVQKAFLESELLVRMRKAQGKTQDSVSLGVCARETLSNIEHGREANPRKKKQLLDKMGVRQNKYYSYVEAGYFEIYELLYRYERYLFQEDVTGMERVLSELEKKLDKTLPENRKFLGMARIIQGIWKERVTLEEAVFRLEGLLRQTMPEYAGCICRNPYREEFILLYQLLICLRRLGRVTEVVTICETIRRQFVDSKVTMQYRKEEVLLLYRMYVGILDSCGLRENVEKYRREWREVALKHQRGYLNFMHPFFME